MEMVIFYSVKFLFLERFFVKADHWPWGKQNSDKRVKIGVRFLSPMYVQYDMKKFNKGVKDFSFSSDGEEPT